MNNRILLEDVKCFASDDMSVGFVMVMDTETNSYACYTGHATEDVDANIFNILDNGAFVPQRVCEAVFRCKVGSYKDCRA
jgi:hypothetical protein